MCWEARSLVNTGLQGFWHPYKQVCVGNYDNRNWTEQSVVAQWLIACRQRFSPRGSELVFSSFFFCCIFKCYEVKQSLSYSALPYLLTVWVLQSYKTQCSCVWHIVARHYVTTSLPPCIQTHFLHDSCACALVFHAFTCLLEWFEMTEVHNCHFIPHTVLFACLPIASILFVLICLYINIFMVPLGVTHLRNLKPLHLRV